MGLHRALYINYYHWQAVVVVNLNVCLIIQLRNVLLKYHLMSGHLRENYTSGTTTLTLPNAASYNGREIMVKVTTNKTVVSASSNVVPLAGGSAGTAILPATAGKWATLVSDGTNWIIMQAN